MKQIDEQEGRTIFGLNPSGYNQARPPYPEWMYALLCDQKALFPGAATLEVGAGNGLATRWLIRAGVSPLILLEPDRRFGPLLQAITTTEGIDCQILHQTFEEAHFEPASFDLVLIATAFHWLDPRLRLEKLARILRPGGHVALVWHVFQDLYRPQPFHQATQHLLSGLAASPSGPDSLPFALDKQAREAEFLQGGSFESLMYAESHWSLRLNPGQVSQLFEGFSGVARLPQEQRQALLEELAHIAQTQFSGTVTFNMTSPLYLFRHT